MRAAQARGVPDLAADAQELQPSTREKLRGLAASQLLDTLKSCTTFVVSEAAFGAMFMDLHETLTQCTPHTHCARLCLVSSVVLRVCAVRLLEM